MIPRWVPWAAAGVVVVGAVRARSPSRRRKSSVPAPPGPGPGPGPGPSSTGCTGVTPMAVGKPSDPEVADLLVEMDQYLRSQGVDTDLADAREVTRMPNAPGQPSAIPPRSAWGHMAATLRDVVIPLRLQMGIPFALRGYRPDDYNDAVGGADCSRHEHFDAVDIYLSGPQNTAENRRLLALRAAQFFLAHGSKLKMGFGAYGAPTPSNVHVDTGHKKRTWREAQHYLNLAQS